MRATVFGAKGFVGGHLVRELSARGYEVLALGRGDPVPFDRSLGHAFYTIGLTADFRSRPFETIDAHVSLLTDILRRTSFESFVYCSSTRVYATTQTTDEATLIPVASANPDHLYNISKLMGEAVCLGSGRRGARVARLSNVFGEDLASANFLTAVLGEAVSTGAVHLKTSLASAKDYVAVEDVARGIIAIAERGEDGVYNVASGRNTSHGEIMEALSGVTGARIDVAEGAPTITFPEIETGKLDGLIGPERIRLAERIPALVDAFRTRLSQG